MTNLDLSRANWRISSHSGGNGNCVQVAANLPGIIAVRDSKNSAGPELIFFPASWSAFTTAVRAGDFDIA